MGISIKMILFVAMGGAIGAVGRFLVMSGIGHWAGHGFPWGTLAVNVLGSLILGAIVELSALAWDPAPEIRAMIVIGVLGAFTTFSTFSMDVYDLFNRGAVLPGVAYITGSVVVCVVAFWGGLFLTRQLIT